MRNERCRAIPVHSRFVHCFACGKIFKDSGQDTWGIKEQNEKSRIVKSLRPKQDLGFDVQGLGSPYVVKDCITC